MTTHSKQRFWLLMVGFIVMAWSPVIGGGMVLWSLFGHFLFPPKDLVERGAELWSPEELRKEDLIYKGLQKEEEDGPDSTDQDGRNSASDTTDRSREESCYCKHCGHEMSTYALACLQCDAPKNAEDFLRWQHEKRPQLDTHRSITISPAQAARGCKVRVQTETGTKIVLSIPKNTRSGTQLRVSGRGKRNVGGRVGDLYVGVDIR